MKEQGVTDVYKFTKLAEDGKTRIPTGKIILTFDLYRLPATVDVAWYKCKVDFYYPNPMFCKNCQRLGHTKKHCRGSPTCPQCSLPPHETAECTRTLCSNCSENHTSDDKNCPRYLQMKEILKIKTKHYCSIGEARRRYREDNPVTSVNQTTSYSSSVKYSKPINSKQNVATPTSVSDNQPSTSKKIQNLSNAKTPNEKQPPTETNNTTTLKKYTTSIQPPETSSVKDHSSLETPKHSVISNQKSYTSPLSLITQNLLKENQYYLSSKSPDATTMDLET